MRKALLLLFILLLLTVSVSAADDQINNLTQEISVNSDGEVTMTVTAEVTFTGAPKRFLFPLGRDADDVITSGASCEVESMNGSEYAIFTDAAGFSGRRTFVCSYTLPSAVVNNAEGQQFTLALIEKGWEYPVAALSVHMQFPAEITAQPVWTSAYYGDVIDNYLNIQIGEDRTIDVSTTTELKDHEQLTMALQFPAETFEMYHQRGTTVTVFSTIFYVLTLLALVYWFFTLRSKLLLPKKQQSVGMEATAGELACQLYGTAPDIAATLAYWGNLGYLTIHRTRRGRILLQKQMDMGNERKFSERRLFESIFRSGDTVDATMERFRVRALESGGSLRQGWLRRLFDPHSGSPKLLARGMLLASLALNLMLFDLWMAEIVVRWLLIPILAVFSTVLCELFRRGLTEFLRGKYLHFLIGLLSAVLLMMFAVFAGCAGIMLWNLLLHAFFALMTCFGGRRTDEGMEAAQHLLGLRHHLRTADMTKAIDADNQYFYRTLPFAELLGVGAAFAKHCKRLPADPCPWLFDARNQPKTTKDFYRLYVDIASALRADSTDLLATLLDPSSRPRSTAPHGRTRRTKNASRPRRTVTNDRRRENTRRRRPVAGRSEEAAGRPRRNTERR